jgi:2-polyprenyl-3-methyl-5-hydroxy-6-metoxy-1,4-benzoquinol methylase
MIVYKQNWVLRQLGGKGGTKGSILDFGCNGDDGKAFLHRFLKSKLPDAKITGVDIEKSDNVDVVFDLNNSFPRSWEGKYDFVVAGAVIEHLLDPFGFLIRCKKALKPKGRLILDTNNAAYYAIKYPIEKRIVGHEIDHYYAFNADMLRKLLTKAGFKVVSIEHGMLYQRMTMKLIVSMFPVFEYVLYSLFPKLSSELYIVAEKP